MLRSSPKRAPLDAARSRFVRTIIVAAALLPSAWGCGGGDDTTAPLTPARLTLSQGSTDTVEARIAAPLVAVLTTVDGKPVPDVLVRFYDSAEGILLDDDPAPKPRNTPEFPTSQLIIRTNSSGEARAWVTMDRKAGTFRVTAFALSETLYDTAMFVVRAGAPVSIELTPGDTAAYVGRPFQLRPLIRDRFHNLSDIVPMFFSNRTDVATVDANGIVRATKIGRLQLSASLGGVTGVAMLSVVPQGRLASYGRRENTGVIGSFYLFDLDGSNMRSFLPGPILTSDRALRWSPGGNQIVYEETDGPTQITHVHLADTIDATRKVVPSSLGLFDTTRPQFSASGEWIYFAGRPGHQNAELWRIRPDGTGGERIGEAANFYAKDFAPSPSPDGTRVAFATNRSPLANPAIRVLTIASGAVLELDLPGTNPRWSPVADEIAYISPTGRIMVSAADGSWTVTADSTRGYDGTVDWSPDGRWLIGCSKQVVLIDRQSSEVLPLEFTKLDHLCEGIWRPTP